MSGHSAGSSEVLRRILPFAGARYALGRTKLSATPRHTLRPLGRGLRIGLFGEMGLNSIEESAHHASPIGVVVTSESPSPC